MNEKSVLPKITVVRKFSTNSKYFLEHLLAKGKTLFANP